MNDIPEMFGRDYNVGGEERPLANTIKARYDAGVTNFKQDGTAVGIPISFADGQIIKEIDTAHCLSALGPSKEGIHTHQEMNRVVMPVITPDRENKRQNGRRFKDDGEPAFTLTSQDIHGVAIEVSDETVLDPNVLRTVRSEYGKQIRKDYESGNINISRHEFLEYEMRNDGISNTIDSVQKDNHVAIPVKEATKKGYALAHEGDSINLSMPESQTRRGRVGGAMAQTLDTSCNQGILVTKKENVPSEDHESI